MRLFSKISTFLSPLVYLFGTPSLAFAQTQVKVCPEGQFNPLCKFTEGSFGGIVGTAITIIFIVAIIIALVFLIYGGIKWIISGGDKAAVEGARNTIVAAIVGLVIVFMSYFILNIILGFFNLSLDPEKLLLPKFKP